MARSAVKREQILGELREEIVRGVVPIGARLPTRLDLEKRFQVSGATIQQALDRLGSEGFVIAQGSRGTFVADNPPHLFRYGLIFPAKAEEKHRFSRYYTALSAAADLLERAGERRIARYYGFDGHTDGDDYPRLVQNLRNHRLAGLIFSTPPDALKGTPVLDMHGIPRVVMRDHDPYDGMATLRLDHGAFLHRAIKDLLAKGRRKIAVVRLHSLAEHAVTDVMTSFGLEVRPHWMQMGSISVPEMIRPVIRLLMHPAQADRPDGLIITDDNLETDAIGGLLDAQVRVPEDIAVVSHCNLPPAVRTPLPIRRLGYDSRRILNACIELVDRQRAGEPPASIGLQPVFEGEFPNT